MDSKNNPRKRQEEVPKNRPPSSKKPRRRRNNNKSGGGNNSNSSSSNNNADNASNSTNNVAGAGKNLHQFSKVTFASNEHISANSKRALTEVMQYEYMSKVQEATLPSILEGKDVVAKAKTGSGKTTAFLLPIIESLSEANKSNENHDNISAVILSPTRELANQISVEFEKLATFHPKMKSQSITLIGGTNIDKDRKQLERDHNIRVVIATPGRLQDHLAKNTANIIGRIARVDILCLDEADRLLDMGFRQELEKIMGYMPRVHEDTGEERQTLLFSATFPEAMKDITRVAMRPDFQLIDTLDEHEGDANVQVIQKCLVTPLQHHMIALEHVLQDHIEEQKSKNQAYKIIVFFTTARIAGYTAELFRADPRYPHYNERNLLEMHSRKSQSYRTNVAKKFTSESNVVLFSSDVSARGVDYPDVTAVLQVGAPSDKAQYIHRLGRTARAGNSGVGIIILSDFEQVFLKDLSDSEVENFEMKLSSEEAKQEQEHFRKLIDSNADLKKSAIAAYQAFLGYYNSNVRRFRIDGKKELVQIANEYATILGFPEGQPPELQAKTVGKMGLKGVPGINVERFKGQPGGGGRGRGGGGRGGGPGRGRGRR